MGVHSRIEVQVMSRARRRDFLTQQRCGATDLGVETCLGFRLRHPRHLRARHLRCRLPRRPRRVLVSATRLEIKMRNVV